MPGWVWLVLAWLLIAPAVAVAVGAAMHTADERDWVRRGRPDRRSAPRIP